MLKKRILFVAVPSIVVLLSVVALNTFSHCQIPCGIYDDEARFKALNEHITTIEKSMKSIVQLSQDKTNANQIVRWVQNKDHHADEFSEIITQYFLAQRIKPVSDTGSKAYKDYTQKLVLLHGSIFHAMKAKQTTDLSHVEALRKSVSDFHELYSAH